MGKSFLQRLHAKEYAASWKNPLFSDPKVRDRAHERTRLVMYSALMGTALVACGALAFWFATQDRFFLNDIVVTGMRSVPNEKLALMAWHEVRQCTRFGAPCMFTWNESAADVAKQLSGAYTLEQIEVMPNEHALTITVKEAVTLIPVKIGNDIWFATQGGVLQTKATPEDIAAGILIPPDAYHEIDVTQALLKDQAIEAGAQILTPETFAAIATYQKTFAANGIAITSYACTSDAGKVIAHTSQGYLVYITPWQDAETQVRRMLEVLKEASPQAYIDIRFGERIYVK